MSGQAATVTLNNMPEVLTIVDMSEVMRMEVHLTRLFVRRHSSVLRPFKAGREVRCLACNFKKLLDDLQQAAN